MISFAFNFDDDEELDCIPLANVEFVKMLHNFSDGRRKSLPQAVTHSASGEINVEREDEAKPVSTTSSQRVGQIDGPIVYGFRL